jgi:hypothetical protein
MCTSIDFWYLSYGLERAFSSLHVGQSKEIPARSSTGRSFFFFVCERVMLHLNSCCAGL